MTVMLDFVQPGVALRRHEAGRDDLEANGEDPAEVFAGPVLTACDDRRDYGRMVHVAWTPRGEDRHVMSMRKCNDREQARLGQQLGKARRDDG